MSLVGTRPPTMDEWEKYELHHRKRLAIKPGLTGMWQVSGRSDITDFEEVVELDTKYIAEWCLKLDIEILVKTVQEAIGRVIVMADAAHAFGATWHGKPVGSIADFSNFSFHAVKNFTTAEGGAVAWRDIEGIDNEEIYHQYQLLSLHGQSKDALAKTQLGAWEYDIIGPWFKCNMTDVVAGIGLAQMKRYKGLLARRKEIISRYDAAFKPLI